MRNQCCQNCVTVTHPNPQQRHPSEQSCLENSVLCRGGTPPIHPPRLHKQRHIPIIVMSRPITLTKPPVTSRNNNITITTAPGTSAEASTITPVASTTTTTVAPTTTASTGISMAASATTTAAPAMTTVQLLRRHRR